jgi:hypothetical protein
MDWKFWLPLGVNIVGVYFAYRQLQLTQPVSSQEGNPLVMYWPMLLMVLLCVGVWVPYLLFPNQPVNKTQTTIGFGPDRCAAEIDTTFFMKYREDYKIALVCGVHNPAKDRYEDRSISISRPFTIVEGRIQIDVPYTAEMMKASQEYVADYAKSFHPSRSGAPNLPLLGSFWNEWILIPKSVSVEDIKKLSDIDAYKGKIVKRDIPGA